MNVRPQILHLVTIVVYIAGVITHKEGMVVYAIVTTSLIRMVWHAPVSMKLLSIDKIISGSCV